MATGQLVVQLIIHLFSVNTSYVLMTLTTTTIAYQTVYPTWKLYLKPRVMIRVQAPTMTTRRDASSVERGVLAAIFIQFVYNVLHVMNNMAHYLTMTTVAAQHIMNPHHLMKIMEMILKDVMDAIGNVQGSDTASH